MTGKGKQVTRSNVRKEGKVSHQNWDKRGVKMQQRDGNTDDGRGLVDMDDLKELVERLRLWPQVYRPLYRGSNGI